MFVLVLLFLVVPIAELYVIVQTSQAIGFLNTLGVLVLVSLIGGWLVKREGVRVWTRFQQQVAAHRIPSKEIADGVCIMAAGALLLTPGFLTDIVGVLLLLPPTRALVRPLLVGAAAKRTRVVTATMGPRIYDTTSRADQPPSGGPAPGPPAGELDR